MRDCNCAQNLGAVFAPVDPSAERVQFAVGEPTPTAPAKITLDDIWQIVGLFQIAKFLTEL